MKEQINIFKASSGIITLKIEGTIIALKDIIIILKNIDIDIYYISQPKRIIPNPEGGDPQEEAFIIVSYKEEFIDQTLEELKRVYSFDEVLPLN